MHKQIEIRRLDLWSLFKIAFFVYMAIGLVVGIFYALFAIVASSFTALIEEDLPFGFLGGFLSLFVIPICAILYGAFGSVFITLGGLVYNLIAAFVGGLRFDAEVVEPEVLMAQPAPAVPPAPTPPATRPTDGGEDGDVKAPNIDLS